MNRLFILILIICCAGGCTLRMAVSNSTTIGTDANGYAFGQYSDSREGCIQSPSSSWLGGGGGGGGVQGLGLGMVAGGFSTGRVETQGDPMRFARAVATINYSRRLVTADDVGGARNFTFTDSPLRKRSYQPFGHTE